MKKKLSLVLLIAWLALIFIMSSFDAAASDSQSNLIVTDLISIFNGGDVHILTLLVRKGAHLMEYLILGVLMINYIKLVKKEDVYKLSILLSIAYACLDEIHQMFVPGRAGMIGDVIIDSIGIVIGIYMYKIFVKKYD